MSKRKLLDNVNDMMMTYKVLGYNYAFILMMVFTLEITLIIR